MAASTITKHRADAPPTFFALEAAGLRWLDVGDGAVPVAGVIAVGDHHIELERLHPGPARRADAEEFGRRLATTHDAGADGWGAAPPGIVGTDAWIGELPQPNLVEPTWGAMYAKHRVLHPARIAHQQGILTDSELAEIDSLADRLIDGDFDDATEPARIHGDLWSGNVIATANGFTLIDPAAHGGHRITDLAMLEVFGNPYLEATWDAYAEASDQLPDHWRELIGLHQVHPLLVHTALFGRGYADSAMAAVRRYR